MRKIFLLSTAFVIIFTLALVTEGSANATINTIPTFTIIQIIENESITIKTYNFPAEMEFDVLMNEINTRGINGINVGSFTSMTGGSLIKSYKIPEKLIGEYTIAVRIQSSEEPDYFAYNWFYNDTSETSIFGESTGKEIPYIIILQVDQNESVTIETKNFPQNDSFDVLMGEMGTRGIDGIKVDTVSSSTGGELIFSFEIPATLDDVHQIAIRLQSNTGSNYYAYNWFVNKSYGNYIDKPDSTTKTSNLYSGFPLFSVEDVDRDTAVSILAYNLPANDTFDVTMGSIATKGINGYYIKSISTADGGELNFTFPIPAQLQGSDQITIRLQSNSGSGYYTYNWFHNR